MADVGCGSGRVTAHLNSLGRDVFGKLTCRRGWLLRHEAHTRVCASTRDQCWLWISKMGPRDSQREEAANVMVTLSRFNTIAPRSKILDEELALAFNRRFGRSSFPVRNTKF